MLQLHRLSSVSSASRRQFVVALGTTTTTTSSSRCLLPRNQTKTTGGLRLFSTVSPSSFSSSSLASASASASAFFPLKVAYPAAGVAQTRFLHSSHVALNNPSSPSSPDTAPHAVSSSPPNAPHPSGPMHQGNARHFKDPSQEFWTNPINHEVWSPEELEQIKETHRPRQDWTDFFAYFTVKLLRWSFDTFSGYSFGQLTEAKVLNRAIFLETVAGCPGMAGGMIRHLNSLRKMERDHGWIHTLLEEAENERMHLLTFIKLKQPGVVFRSVVLLTQGIFMNGFFFFYLINPRLCHRFVGYLEEEAVHTYSSILAAIEDGRLGAWKTKEAPLIAIQYWRLKETATMKDLILAVRADEANHRDTNHVFANIKPHETNPYIAKKK